MFRRTSVLSVDIRRFFGSKYIVLRCVRLSLLLRNWILSKLTRKKIKKTRNEMKIVQALTEQGNDLNYYNNPHCGPIFFGGANRLLLFIKSISELRTSEFSFNSCTKRKIEKSQFISLLLWLLWMYNVQLRRTTVWREREFSPKHTWVFLVFMSHVHCNFHGIELSSHTTDIML